jgi:hypothetical protein
LPVFSCQRLIYDSHLGPRGALRGTRLGPLLCEAASHRGLRSLIPRFSKRLQPLVIFLAHALVGLGEQGSDLLIWGCSVLILLFCVVRRL